MMIPALGAYRVTLLRTLLRSIRVSHIRKTMIKRRLCEFNESAERSPRGQSETNNVVFSADQNVGT